MLFRPYLISSRSCLLEKNCRTYAERHPTLHAHIRVIDTVFPYRVAHLDPVLMLSLCVLLGSKHFPRLIVRSVM